MASPPTASQGDDAHWRRTTSLMGLHLGLWFFFAFVVHMLAPVLNKVAVFGFPLGFYMATQGAPLLFLVQLVLFVRQQRRIDREACVAEDEF
jgi:putative solute:sodium symporter small subunit